MADVSSKIITANDIRKGGITVRVSPLSFLSSGVLVDDDLSGLENQYTDRVDDVTYYGNSEFSPLSLLPVLWLDAGDVVASDGDPVQTWADKSGNGKDLTQVTGTKQPLWKTGIINGLPTLRFDGVDDFMVSTRTVIQPCTIFLVIDWIAAAGFNYLFDDISTPDSLVIWRNSSTQWAFYAGTEVDINISTSIPSIMMFVANGASSVCRVNATQVSSSAGAGNINNGMMIGSRGVAGSPSQFFGGDIAEIIVYSSDLSVDNRSSVLTYLSEKYAITI
jgi:hypothetical protein